MYSIRPLIILCLLTCVKSFGQNDFETLGESAFAINHKVSESYRINFSAKARYFLYRDNDFEFENRQVGIVHFSTYKLDYTNSISFGIQYRLRENFDGDSNELRLTQQYNFTKQNLATRYGHRFRFEQRFIGDITIFRYRYRFALDYPLNGDKLDIGESYLVSSMEALLSQGKTIKPEIDHRTTLQIGWLVKEKLKLQTGFEYRFEAFNIATEQKLFLLTSAILKL